MTTVSYALGRPLPAPLRGGDCRARDLSIGTEGRNVHGPHRFVSPDHCRISNGILRATVGAAGSAPTLSLECYVGVQTVDDFFFDVYHDLYGGHEEDQGWETSCTVTIDSPSVSALLTGVRLELVSPEIVILRLVAPLMGDAWVSLRRGERMVRIAHGERREAVDIDRRVSLSAPGLTGSSPAAGRIKETGAVIGDFERFVAAIDPVTIDTGAFSLTASSVTSARFGAGAGTGDSMDTPADLHRQLLSATRQRIEIDETV